MKEKLDEMIKQILKPMLEKSGADYATIVFRGKKDAVVIGYFNRTISDENDVEIIEKAKK